MFELAARSALVAYGVPPAVALSAGLVLHAVSTLPFIVLGAIGMARLGVSGASSARAESVELICEDCARRCRRRTCCSPARGMRGDMVAAFQAALAA